MKYTKPVVAASETGDGPTPRWCWFGYSCNNGVYTCDSTHKCIGTFTCTGTYNSK